MIIVNRQGTRSQKSSPGLLQELKLYPAGTGWPGNAFYFRALAILSRIGFEADKNKASFEAFVFMHFGYDENCENVVLV